MSWGRPAPAAAIEDCAEDRDLYLVERSCGGPNAAGGGCGAWYVEAVRELRPEDRLVSRASPESERAFYVGGQVCALWPRADLHRAIRGTPWVCSECYRT